MHILLPPSVQLQEIEKDTFVELNMFSCSSISLMLINIVLISISSLRPEFCRHRETILVMFLIGDFLSYNLANVQMQPKESLLNNIETSSHICRVNNYFQQFVVLLIDTAVICVTNAAFERNPVLMAKITKKLCFLVLCLFDGSAWVMALLSMSLVRRNFCLSSLYGETDNHWWKVQLAWSGQDLTAFLAFFRAAFTMLAVCFNFVLNQNIKNKDIMYI